MERTRRTQETHRRFVEEERERLELAREIALGRAALPSLPVEEGPHLGRLEAQRDLELLRSYVQEFMDYQQRVGGLELATWMDAHLDRYLLRCQEHERAERRALTPDGDLRTRRRKELELPSVEPTKDLGLHLGQEVMELIDGPIEEVRRREDWWEIAVGVLLLVDLDVPLSVLGISQPLIERGWKEGSSEDLFDHREGLRDYAFANPDLREEERVRWDRMWLMAGRAVALLREEPWAPIAADSEAEERIVIREIDGRRSDAPAIEIVRILGKRQIDRVLISGPSLVRMFLAVQRLSAESPGPSAIDWEAIERAFGDAGGWKGKLPKQETLADYSRIILRMLREGGLGRFWVHVPERGAKWLGSSGTRPDIET